jgi:hypothetical protein
MNIALASELFPEKVAAAVFLSAFMPDNSSPPSYVLDKVYTARHYRICRSLLFVPLKRIT